MGGGQAYLRRYQKSFRFSDAVNQSPNNQSPINFLIKILSEINFLLSNFFVKMSKLRKAGEGGGTLGSDVTLNS